MSRTYTRNRDLWNKDHPHIVKVANAVFEVISDIPTLHCRVTQDWTFKSHVPIYLDGRRFVECELPHEPRKENCQKTNVHIYPLRDKNTEWMQKWGRQVRELGIGSLQEKTNRLRVSFESPSMVDDYRKTIAELMRDAAASESR